MVLPSPNRAWFYAEPLAGLPQILVLTPAALGSYGTVGADGNVGGAGIATGGSTGGDDGGSGMRTGTGPGTGMESGVGAGPGPGTGTG